MFAPSFEMIFWYWWGLAVLLWAIEVVAPGFFFLWMGLGAFLTGVILWLAPHLSLDGQLLFFSAFSVSAFAIWRFYLRRHPTESDQPLLNQRPRQYIGRVFELDEPIVNGSGRIKVDDTYWRVSGADCAKPGKVRVVGVEGMVLQVEKVIAN